MKKLLIPFAILCCLVACSKKPDQNSIVFEALNINPTLDETINQDLFSNYDLTMVNVWSIDCPPCMNEIPDLVELRQELKDSNMQLISICLDASSRSNDHNDKMLERVKNVIKDKGINFEVLLRNDDIDKIVSGFAAIPTSIFINRTGVIVGEPVVGSQTKEQYQSIMEERAAQ